MGGIWKKEKRPKQEGGEPKPPPPATPRNEDDDYEDGDMATPKRDRYGPDDEPL